MPTSKSYIKYFLVLMLLTATLYLGLHFFLGGVEAVLLTNGTHTPFLDFTYKWLTRLGEYLGLAILALLLLKDKALKWLAISTLLSLLALFLSWFFKKVVFVDSARPRKLLGNDELIHFVEGVFINSENSYPSGHTMIAVTCATIMAWYYRKYFNIQVAIWLLASLAGLSRVYLFQHFYIDVATSICIAVFVNSAIIYSLRKQLFTT